MVYLAITFPVNSFKSGDSNGYFHVKDGVTSSSLVNACVVAQLVRARKISVALIPS